MNYKDFLSNFKNQSFVENIKSIHHNFAATHDEENKTSTITVYGFIGSSWDDEATSANDVDKALKAAGNNDIVIRLNSGGGSAFDGIAIYNRLKEHPGKVTIHVDGYACSAASIIMLAGDEVYFGVGAMAMIHEASTIVWGSKKDFRQQADILEKLEAGIVDIYMTKATIERDEIATMVDNETWFTAVEAVAIGFANEVVENVEPDVKNEIKPDAETFKQNVLSRLSVKQPKTGILNNFIKKTN